MKLTDSLKLLRDYADRGDEAAFRELVGRYIDLVYSTAVRRVGGDADLAQDVTQTVFSDLARKAGSLRNVELLGGWLHRHTGFVAATVVRSEHRRQVREQEAIQMNALNDSPDALWQQLGPILDETIESLDPPDRQAILLRFFERRDFRSIGTTLGISDDAAQKRVSRALDRLREVLLRRGVSLSLVLLGTLMAGKVVKAAPSGLAADVARLALAGAAGGGGLALTFTKLTNSLPLKICLGGAVLAMVVWLALPRHSTPAQPKIPQRDIVPASARVAGGSSSHFPFPVTVPKPRSDEENLTGNTLQLSIVARVDGQPVPNVKLDYWLWANGHLSHQKPLQASALGVCEVPVPDGTTELLLASEHEGFADTRLDWRPDRGEQIPVQYTLRLAPAVPIGGEVTDPDGKPVAGAQVGFNNQPDPADERRPQSDDFGWPFWITATTDEQGHWQIDRIGRDAIRTIYGGATHPDYVGSKFVSVAGDPNAEKQLLAGNRMFILNRAVTVRGTVTDPSGQPVSDAKVLVGHLSESGARQTTNLPDGTFSVRGCKPGQNLITAQAKGYAPTTLQVDLTNSSGPFQITLRPGNRLKLQVVDPSENPVPDAQVWLNTFDTMNFDPTSPPPVQVEFNRRTDADGRLEWDSAPDQELTFDVSAAGYMRTDGVLLRPNGTEHTIVLQPALTISGTVNDAETGKPIPRFRIITGWPSWSPMNNTTNAQWSTLDRFWLSFDGGKFQHTYEEPVIGGRTNPEFMFKFEAKGYAPFITRSVRAAERHIRFEVALHPASSTEVTVLTPDGAVAARADIGLVSPGARLDLVPGGFSRDNVQSGGTLLWTDSQGRFRLPPDPTITQVVAAAQQGYASATPAELATDPVIRLQPWGRLEGTYLSHGQPVACAAIRFQYGHGNLNTISCDFSAFQTKTDQEGRFMFANVPPGHHELELVVPENQMGQQAWGSIPVQKVTIRSGETTTTRIDRTN